MIKNRIKGKTVLITGASSGIGYAAAKAFAAMGANLILTARRVGVVDKLKEELLQEHKINIFSMALDVTKKRHAEELFTTLPEEFAKIDILVNNAGLSLSMDPIVDGASEEWETMINTNIKGMLLVTQQVLKIMQKRRTGHIINLGSISGVFPYANGAVYCATKSAVHAFSRALREESVKFNIKISEVMPGAVNTEFSEVRFHGDKQKADNVYKGFTPLVAADVADLIVYMANLPKDVNLAEAMIMPTAQASIATVHRNK